MDLQVVSLLLPLRYDLVYLGGSWAQRQVLSVTLIHAAINSKQLSLALALVAELKVHKHNIVQVASLTCPLQLLTGTLRTGSKNGASRTL